MKKKGLIAILAILAVCFWAVWAFAVNVTYHFKAEYVEKIIEGTCYLHKNVETIPNPAYVPPEIDDGEGNIIPNPDYVGEPETIPAFTDAQWTKEVYRRKIIVDTLRGLLNKQRAEEEMITLPSDAVTTE